jgi:hypothetical protein
MSNPIWRTTGFQVPQHTSLCSLFFYFSANKIPFIFACVPAFYFYVSAEQGPSTPKNSSVSSGDHEGTLLLHVRLVQVAPNWKGLPRKWP